MCIIWSVKIITGLDKHIYHTVGRGTRFTNFCIFKPEPRLPASLTNTLWSRLELSVSIMFWYFGLVLNIIPLQSVPRHNIFWDVLWVRAINTYIYKDSQLASCLTWAKVCRSELLWHCWDWPSGHVSRCNSILNVESVDDVKRKLQTNAECKSTFVS